MSTELDNMHAVIDSFKEVNANLSRMANGIDLLNQHFAGSVATAVQPTKAVQLARLSFSAKPSQFYKSVELPQVLSDPRTWPDDDVTIRRLLNTNVGTLYHWWNAVVGLNHESVWTAGYALLGYEHGFHVRHNQELLAARLGKKKIRPLDMLQWLGRDIQLAQVLYDNYGHQQPFVMPLSYSDNRHEDFVPVGRKAGKTYPWQDRNYVPPVRPVGKTRSAKQSGNQNVVNAEAKQEVVQKLKRSKTKKDSTKQLSAKTFLPALVIAGPPFRS